MNTLTLFALEVAISIGISMSVVLVLKPLLMDVLTESCGTEKRAAFWAMFTQLMVYISPLLMVIFFAPTDPILEGGLVVALKETLFTSLLGVFIALAAVGKVIWRSIPTTTPPNRATPSSHSPAEG